MYRRMRGTWRSWAGTSHWPLIQRIFWVQYNQKEPWTVIHTNTLWISQLTISPWTIIPKICVLNFPAVTSLILIWKKRTCMQYFQGLVNLSFSTIVLLCFQISLLIWYIYLQKNLCYTTLAPLCIDIKTSGWAWFF